MYCTNCGNERRAEQQFCSHCGCKHEDQKVIPFSSFVEQKSKERTSHFSGKSKAKKSDNRYSKNVVIYASLLRKVNGEYRQERGSRLPIKVNVDWDYLKLKDAVYEKFVRYNTAVSLLEKHDVQLVYKNGKMIRFIPGTQQPFTVKGYKEDLGIGYQSVVVYLLPHEYDEESDSEANGTNNTDELPSSGLSYFANSTSQSAVYSSCTVVNSSSSTQVTQQRPAMRTSSSASLPSSSVVRNETTFSNYFTNSNSQSASIYSSCTVVNSSSNTQVTQHRPALRTSSSASLPSSSVVRNETTLSNKRKRCLSCLADYRDVCLTCKEDNDSINLSDNEDVFSQIPENFGQFEEANPNQTHSALSGNDTPQTENNEDEEVVVYKNAKIHRLNIKNDIIDLFLQENILDYNLRLQVIDHRGEEESGVGDGVVRDVLCTFFEEIKTSHMVGCQEKVFTIRHDMAQIHWKAIARALLYGLKVGYFPLFISEGFMLSCLYGEPEIDPFVLLNSFKKYVTLEEKQVIEEMLSLFEENNEILMDLLSNFKCYKMPREDTLKDILIEIAHQELIQKPKYISNCFSSVFKEAKHLIPFSSTEDLAQFYKQKSPTTRNVIKCLVPISESDNQRRVFEYLTQYVRTLDKKELSLFLRFVTGADVLPSTIQVSFFDSIPNFPKARTCVPQLQLPETYTCFNELSEQMSNILKAPDSFQFHFM